MSRNCVQNPTRRLRDPGVYSRPTRILGDGGLTVYCRHVIAQCQFCRPFSTKRCELWEISGCTQAVSGCSAEKYNAALNVLWVEEISYVETVVVG